METKIKQNKKKQHLEVNNMLPPNARVTRSMVVGKNLLIVTFPNFNRTLHHKINIVWELLPLKAFLRLCWWWGRSYVFVDREGALTSLLMVRAFLRLCWWWRRSYVFVDGEGVLTFLLMVRAFLRLCWWTAIHVFLIFY